IENLIVLLNFRRLARTTSRLDQLPPRMMIRLRHPPRRMQQPPPLLLAHLRQLRAIRIERFEQLRGNADAVGEGEVVVSHRFYLRSSATSADCFTQSAPRTPLRPAPAVPPALLRLRCRVGRTGGGN